MLKIKTCPTCGSRRIRLVVGDYHGNFRGKQYVARYVEHHGCPNCGEKLFDPEAMRRIESSRPGHKRKTRVA
jgi:YgiT-type zinc finger domain-containing protein